MSGKNGPILNYRLCKKIGFLALSAILLLSSCEKNSSDSDDLTGNWKRRSEFEGVGRTEAVSFTIGNKVYVGGGYDGSNRLNDFWSFDQGTGTWLRIADFPGNARNSAVGFSINGKGYVGTGYDDNDTKLKDFWEYDPSTNTWTRKADFGGSGRYNAIGFSIGGKGYIGTGYDGNYLKDLWQFDPLTNTWAQVASLTGSKRSEAVVFVYNDLAYVVTGLNNGSFLTDMWVYNPATNSWSEKRKINDASSESYDDDYDSNIQRANGSVFIIGGKAYLACGSNGSATASTWEYDIASDLWVQKTGLEGSSREGAVGFTLTDRGYIVTGSNSSYRFYDLWEFLPNEEQNDNDN
jgi:N-acetylneuraminic acid mutarotase